jgi:hypothetical protein
MRRKYSEPTAPRGRRAKRRFERSMHAVLSFALLGFALFAPTACARRATAPAPNAGQQAVPGDAQAAQPKPARAPAKQGPVSAQAKGAAAEAPRRPSRKALSASTRAFGLGSPFIARLPEDYSIGPLQDCRAATGSEAEALSVARRFLEGLEKGKLDEDLLLPESRGALALLLAPAEPGASPESAATPEGAALPYRIGRIALSEDGAAASLRVRLGSRAGEERLEGSLSLGFVDGTWYVEALSLDPPAEGGRSPLSFDPSRMGSS